MFTLYFLHVVIQPSLKMHQSGIRNLQSPSATKLFMSHCDKPLNHSYWCQFH